MTVIERERTETVTETERRALILEAAALEIEVRGWAQGEYEDCDGAVCLRGALNVCVTGHPRHESGITPGIFANAFTYGGGMAHWNDEEGRTAADVTFLLRWRAQEIRDGR